MRAALAIGAALLFCAGASARILELSQACFPDFCIEAREAFMRLPGEGPLGVARIRIFSPERVIYLQKQTGPDLPDCGGFCRSDHAEGEPRAFHIHTGALLARVVGPFQDCRGEGAFYVLIRVYLPVVRLDAFEISRNCAARR